MNLYLVNIGLIVGVLVALVLVTRRVRRGLNRVMQRAQDLLADEPLVKDERALVEAVQHAEEATGTDHPEITYDLGYTLRSVFKSWVYRWALIINIVTTAIVLIPVGFAVYKLVTNNQRQALNLNLAALAILIITKGGLFLLTWVLLPAAKAIPAAVAGAVVQKKINEWMGQKKEEKD